MRAYLHTQQNKIIRNVHDQQNVHDQKIVGSQYCCTNFVLPRHQIVWFN